MTEHVVQIRYRDMVLSSGRSKTAVENGSSTQWTQTEAYRRVAEARATVLGLLTIGGKGQAVLTIGRAEPALAREPVTTVAARGAGTAEGDALAGANVVPVLVPQTQAAATIIGHGAGLPLVQTAVQGLVAAATIDSYIRVDAGLCPASTAAAGTTVARHALPTDLARVKAARLASSGTTEQAAAFEVLFAQTATAIVVRNTHLIDGAATGHEQTYRNPGTGV